MTWERWRWALVAIGLLAVVAGTGAWGISGAECGRGTSPSPGQTTSETFSCDGAGYGLLAAWGLGAMALTGVVAVEVVRRLRDTGDDDE